jgi:CubicO group peptidase (beta-lactamase class C family)
MTLIRRRYSPGASRFVGLLALLCMSFPVCAQWIVTGKPVPELSVFDDAMHTMMSNHGITSGQLAVTWQGRLVLAHGYSLNPEPGDVVTQYDSLFRIASVSKPLTSTLINRLIQEGRLALTDRLGDYVELTPSAGQGADPRLADITIRNLLEHLAGFGDQASGTTQGYDPMFDDVEIANALGLGLPVTQADIIQFMNGKNLVSTPGTTYRYSNYGYMLLGRVIESVTGMSYRDYAMQVLGRIGIRDMRLARAELANRAPHEVMYDSGGFTGPTVMNNSGSTVPVEYGGFNIENMDSHGGWLASAVELVRWLSNLDAPGEANAILNSTSVARMYSLPQNYPLPYINGNPFYAEGWQVRDYGNGNRNTWHDGSLPGTTAYVVRIQDGWDFAAILNRRDETGNACYSCQIDSLMWNAHDQVTQWPGGDLFPGWLPRIFHGGFDASL